jgi:hypothetical protein
MSLDPGARRAILDAVNALRDESVATLQRLVRCPSTLGKEAPALEEMARIYEDLGLAPRRIPTEPTALAAHPGFSPPLIGYAGRDNVVAMHTRVRARAAASSCKAMWTWCRKARPRCGPRRPSRPRSAAAACTAAAPAT